MNYEDYWDSFCKKELKFYDVNTKKYKKKSYLHLDYRVWFPDRKKAFKNFILNPENIQSHSFLPFIRIVLKTKRLKNNKKRHKRKLEIKERPICYAAHFDSLVYSFYASALQEKYEQVLQKYGLTDYVLAYRSLNKSNIDFAEDVFKYIENQGDCIAIALDIKGFFDNLEHTILKEKWLETLNVNETVALDRLPKDHFKLYQSLTKYAYIDKDELINTLSITKVQLKKGQLTRFCSIEDFRGKVRSHPTSPIKINQASVGIPQGSPISAVLSNIYMIDYDRRIGGISQGRFLYRRYCDDILVVCKASDFLEIVKELYSEIAKLKLAIQKEKEEIVVFQLGEDGVLKGRHQHTHEVAKKLQYLGFEFDGSKRYIRSSSISRYYRRMKSSIRITISRAKGNKGKGQKIFVKKLHETHTHLGGQNFLTYAFRAASAMSNGNSIKKQVSRHFEILKRSLSNIEVKVEKFKEKSKPH